MTEKGKREADSKPSDAPPPKAPRLQATASGDGMEIVAAIAGESERTLPVPVERDPNLDLLPDAIFDEDDGTPWTATT